MIAKNRSVVLVGMDELTAIQLKVLLEIDNNASRSSIKRLEADGFHVTAGAVKDRIERFAALMDTLHRTLGEPQE